MAEAGHPEGTLERRLEEFLQRLSMDRWIQGQPDDFIADDAVSAAHRLFDPTIHRPLIAAFFGGTGVGKSTLLNRLAGSAVARTGIERPTSREISLYLHASIALKALPNDLPLASVRVAHHDREAVRQILWIDMPDIDSVDEGNRRLVLDWLPLVDVLLYVVSPERYRDDKGWRLLRQHATDHAWIFVLNQWDRAVDLQFQDFKALLREAGFDDPLLLRTDSSAGPVKTVDELHVLEAVLSELSSTHLLAQLERQTHRARLEVLTEGLQSLEVTLGGGRGYAQSLSERWKAIWAEAESDLLAGLEWPIRSIVLELLSGVRPLSPAKADPPAVAVRGPSPAPELPVLWDEWAIGRTEDALAQLLVAAGDFGLPVSPLKTRLTATLQTLEHRVIQKAQLRLRMALAEPGHAIQRRLMQFAFVMSVVLPLSALGWAAYQVVTGYYRSAVDHLEYLGTDFAVHTVLLIGLAWLAPWFAYTRMRPSVEASARRGLRQGIREALAGFEGTVADALEQTDAAQTALMGELAAFQREVQQAAEEAERTGTSPLIRRLMGRPSSPDMR